jgi:sec-independent protein translocase protein TatA
MPRIGFPELIVVLVIALIIFGPGKLPSIGKSLGEAINEFKKASNELLKDTPSEITTEEKKEEK